MNSLIEEEYKFNLEAKNVYAKFIDKWGEDAQIDMCIEEMAELTQALLKLRRHNKYGYKPNMTLQFIANLTEEVADVQFMLNQMKVFVMKESYIEQLQEKLYRTIGKIEEI